MTCWELNSLQGNLACTVADCSKCIADCSNRVTACATGSWFLHYNSQIINLNCSVPFSGLSSTVGVTINCFFIDTTRLHTC